MKQPRTISVVTGGNPDETQLVGAVLLLNGPSWLFVLVMLLVVLGTVSFVARYAARNRVVIPASQSASRVVLRSK